MVKVPARGETTKGLDVSHYDQTIDFGQVKASGFEFCQAKCTEGARLADDRYAQNKAKAHAAGMFFGAYHFFRPAQDPVAQAHFFLQHAGIKPGDMLPMFDWETTSADGVHADVERAKTFLDIVEKEIGQKMIIYGGPYHLESFHLGPEFKNYALWVANYGVAVPRVPSPWTYWSFWQFTGKGSVPGIPSADEDMDLFNGPLQNLLKFKV